MRWPQRPTCHGSFKDTPFKYDDPEWRPENLTAEPYGYPFRTCSYCGSIHPEDLLRHIKEGKVTFDGADWKYGWAHKFYVNGIPNPQAGKIVRCGSRSERKADGTYSNEPIMSPAPEYSRAKWYNDHLTDDGYDEEAIMALLNALKAGSDIEFFFKDGKLYHRSAKSNEPTP